MGFLGHQRAALAGTAEDVTERLGAILHDGREFAEAEADRFRAECRSTEAQTVTSLSEAIAEASAQAFSGRVRAIDRRTAALVAFGMAAAFIAGGGGGWWAGVTTTRAVIVETEDTLRAAFRHGPETARLWVDLMSWNDVRTAIVRCRDSGQIRQEGGRKVCSLLLWVSAPPSVPPP